MKVIKINLEAGHRLGIITMASILIMVSSMVPEIQSRDCQCRFYFVCFRRSKNVVF